jgi:hypothetical protein
MKGYESCEGQQRSREIAEGSRLREGGRKRTLDRTASQENEADVAEGM